MKKTKTSKRSKTVKPKTKKSVRKTGNRTSIYEPCPHPTKSCKHEHVIGTSPCSKLGCGCHGRVVLTTTKTKTKKAK